GLKSWPDSPWTRLNVEASRLEKLTVMRSDGPKSRPTCLTVYPPPDCGWRPGALIPASPGIAPKMGWLMTTGNCSPYFQDLRSAGASWMALATAAVSRSLKLL